MATPLFGAMAPTEGQKILSDNEAQPIQWLQVLTTSLSLDDWPTCNEAMAMMQEQTGQTILERSMHKPNLWQAPNLTRLAFLLHGLVLHENQQSAAQLLGMCLRIANGPVSQLLPEKRLMLSKWYEEKLSSKMTVPGILLHQSTRRLNLPCTKAILDTGINPNITNNIVENTWLCLQLDGQLGTPAEITYPLLIVSRMSASEKAEKMFDLLVERGAYFRSYERSQKAIYDADYVALHWKSRYESLKKKTEQEKEQKK